MPERTALNPIESAMKLAELFTKVSIMKSIRYALGKLFLGVVAACFVGAAMAVTPPAPVAPVVVKLLASWTNPTKRADGTPFAASEIKQANLYITSLDTVIVVPISGGIAPTNYTYTLPSGICIKSTDGIVVTVTDGAGLESAFSNMGRPESDLCGPKPLPGAPVGLKIVTVASGPSQ